MACSKPRLWSTFNLFELDVRDAISFFYLLDADHSGGVDVEEFVMGCLRVRGQANMIDLEISVQEIKRMARETRALAALACVEPSTSPYPGPGSSKLSIPIAPMGGATEEP